MTKDYNYAVFENLLKAKEMPDEHWRRYAEIYMEELIAQLKLAHLKVNNLEDSMERLKQLADEFTQSAKQFSKDVKQN